MMANAAQWLAEGLPARAEYAGTDESIRRALIRELRSQGRVPACHQRGSG